MSLWNTGEYDIRSAPGLTDQWIVAIHPEDVESAGKVINGNRAEAELLAHSMINKWLERHRPTAAASLLLSQPR